MAVLQPEDPVTVIEHDEADCRPVPGGQVYGARVLAATRLYVQVAYNDRSLTRDGTDLFYAQTGWRAFEAGRRWRLRGPAGWLSRPLYPAEVRMMEPMTSSCTWVHEGFEEYIEHSLLGDDVPDEAVVAARELKQ
jgi:hypothetical protein